MEKLEKEVREALDYAVYSCRLKADDFMKMFLVSDLAGQFEKGVPNVVSGISGTELVWAVLRQAGYGEGTFPAPRIEYDCSVEYWCGWMLAYYQWDTGRSFRDILQMVSLEEMSRLYPALHEAPEEKFVDVMNGRVRGRNRPTKLQTFRKNMGYSQRNLSERTGVNLRTLQQYERRSKNINKASAQTLSVLSRTLGCRMEDLLEADLREE